MHKIVAAGAAALMLAAGAVAYAQQPPAGPNNFGRHHFSPEDRAAFVAAHVAALHAGLTLTPEQEKAWPTFEQAYRDLATLRGNHRPGPQSDESFDPVQRAQRRADALTTHGAALKRYADALAPLYKTFDDNQKRRFGMLSHIGREHHHFHQFGFLGNRERGEFGRGWGDYGPRGEFRHHRDEFQRHHDEQSAPL
jgi:zinc resistance-associated protein